jgi:hypothetical protein
VCAYPPRAVPATIPREQLKNLGVPPHGVDIHCITGLVKVSGTIPEAGMVLTTLGHSLQHMNFLNMLVERALKHHHRVALPSSASSVLVKAAL